MADISSGIFNIILGIIFVLIGLKIYWPFKEDAAKRMEGYKQFFLYSGIVLIIIGTLQLIF